MKPSQDKRRPPPELIAQRREPRRQFTDDERSAVASALQTLVPRVKVGEAPPQYLLAALIRFSREEDSRRERLAAYAAVIQAREEGHPLTSTHGARTPTAFDVAAKRIGRSVPWVEDAYKYPRGRKKA